MAEGAVIGRGRRDPYTDQQTALWVKPHPSGFIRQPDPDDPYKADKFRRFQSAVVATAWFKV